MTETRRDSPHVRRLGHKEKPRAVLKAVDLRRPGLSLACGLNGEWVGKGLGGNETDQARPPPSIARCPSRLANAPD